MPACSANSAECYCFTHVVAGNGFDRVSAGLRTSIAGKRAIDAGLRGSVPQSGDNSGLPGIISGLNSLPMVVGVMRKGVYSSYTRNSGRNITGHTTQSPVTLAHLRPKQDQVCWSCITGSFTAYPRQVVLDEVRTSYDGEVVLADDLDLF